MQQTADSSGPGASGSSDVHHLKQTRQQHQQQQQQEEADESAPSTLGSNGNGAASENGPSTGDGLGSAAPPHPGPSQAPDLGSTHGAGAAGAIAATTKSHAGGSGGGGGGGHTQGQGQSQGQSQGQKQPPKTCDNCRKRKVKCVLPADAKPGDTLCQPCRNIDLPCTYLYVKKKPGRTSALVAAYRASHAGADPAPHHALARPNAHAQQQQQHRGKTSASSSGRPSISHSTAFSGARGGSSSPEMETDSERGSSRYRGAGAEQGQGQGLGMGEGGGGMQRHPHAAQGQQPGGPGQHQHLHQNPQHGQIQHPGQDYAGHPLGPSGMGGHLSGMQLGAGPGPQGMVPRAFDQHDPVFNASIAQGISPTGLSTTSDNLTVLGIPPSAPPGGQPPGQAGPGPLPPGAGPGPTPTSSQTPTFPSLGIPIVNTFNPSGNSTASWLDSLLGHTDAHIGSAGIYPPGDDLMDGMPFSPAGALRRMDRDSFGEFTGGPGQGFWSGGGADSMHGAERDSIVGYDTAMPMVGSSSTAASARFPPQQHPGQPPTTNSSPADWPLQSKSTPTSSQHHKKLAIPQLEDVVSWSDLCYFISLFLKYLYPLMPIVHRPTFSEGLATRLDIRDSSFRALLLSIVVYVISQLPTSRMSDSFDIEGLKRLQRRCHRTCLALESFYQENVGLVHVATIMFDYFYLVSIGLTQAAGVRLGIAAQLSYYMGLHSDAKTATLGLDPIEVQLRRRTFWHLYAMDKTRAIPGVPMLLNDFQGVCSFPEETDDEFITSQGTFQQPPQRISFLVGFVSVCKIFRLLSETFFVHRSLHSPCGPPANVGTRWAVEAEDRVHKVVADLPSVMQANGGGNGHAGQNEAAKEVFAMQRANVLITAAIAKFALYDLRASLDVDKEQLAREREDVARDVYSLLISIPTEDLAANGESVRTKVLHIACALCARIPPNRADQDLVKNWWDMFSVISFTQMPAVDSAVSSRSGSPMTSRKKNT